jgi:hypothetical protein
MLFSEQSLKLELHRDDSPQRQSLLAELISGFQRTFPLVEYQIFPAINLLNGQALILAKQRIVRLYGGVALHPSMNRDGLAFALLHETGHHLANGVRLPWDPMLACECAADRWAFSLGHKILNDLTGWKVDIPQALEEVSLLIEATGPKIALSARESPFPVCWAKRWTDRKTSILAQMSMPSDQFCPLSDEILGTDSIQ